MRMLQRYILGELLRVFAFVLSVLTVLLVFVGVFREARESGLGPLQILEILPFVVPSLLPFTIPATLLLTVCVVYGRISADQEIIAAKAAGINVLSLLWPSFALGLVLSVCSFVLTDQAIPWAVANIQRRVTLAMEDIFLDMLRSQLTVSDPQRGFSVTVTAVEGKKLIRPTFQYTPPGSDSAVTLQAQEATLHFDLEQKQVNLHLLRGYVDVEGKRMYFKEQNHPFPLPSAISKPKPRHLSIVRIREQISEFRERLNQQMGRREIETAFALALGDFQRFTTPVYRGYETQIRFDEEDLRKLQTEIHSRYALACSCLFFTLIGGPFSILQGRRQFLTSFFLCFLPILIIYYPVVLLTMNLSKSGTIDPSWGMWLGNSLVCIAGVVILRKVLQH